jgi:thiol-disulfide isomerase/thioredoxin
MRLLWLFIGTLLLCPAAAAQSPEQVTLKGQLVCSICWFEADRSTVTYGDAADMECAAACSEEGVPQALAVFESAGTKLYILEPGRYKPAGRDFLGLVAKYVEIEGDLRTVEGKPHLTVNALKVIDAPAQPEFTGSDIAELALADLTGARQSLESFRGRVVVLNYWATWCEPCKKEMPDLAAIQSDYAALGLQVIGAAGDTAADTEKVLKFVREYKVNFPVWLGATTADMKRMGVGEVLPATVVIDQSGKIVWREVGIFDPAELRKRLDELLLPKVAESVAEAAKKPRPKVSSLVPA